MLYISLSICYYFINLFKVRPSSCAHACIYPQLMCRSYGLNIFSFACQHGPSWGCSARWMLLPFFFCQDWHGRLLPIIVLFYKVYINTLDICLHWLFSRVRSGQSLEGSAPFLRFFFFFGVSDVFGGGSEVVRESFQSLPRELAYLYRPISLGISTLVSGSLSVLPLV